MSSVYFSITVKFNTLGYYAVGLRVTAFLSPMLHNQ